MASRDYDWALFEKAVEITASALRGAMGGENSQPPAFAGQVFKEIFGALKDAAADLPDRGKAGF
jgi:hypothetical protein